MNRTARRHLLSVVTRNDRLPFVATFASPGGDVEGLRRAIEGLRRGGSCVLPPACTIEFVRPKNAPRPVAGKGGRRRGLRGLRDRPTVIRIVPLAGAA